MTSDRAVRTATLLFAAVAVGVVIGWVGRGRQPAPVPAGVTGAAAYTGSSAATRTPTEPTLPAPSATGEALDPDIDAEPAIIPGDVRGGNVADQGWNTGPTRRGPS